MKNLKRLVSVFLAGSVVALSLVGCGTKTEPAVNKEAQAAPASTTVSTDSKAPDKKSDIKIAFIAKNTVDAFHSTVNAAAKTALDALVAKGAIASWSLLDGQTDPVIQSNLADDAINMGANLVILLPAEAAGSASVLTKCADKKIPCIVVNSSTTNTEELAAAYVGSDDEQAGEMMAKFVQEKLPNGGGYAHLQGVIGNSAQIARGKGLHTVLDADKKWTMLPGTEQTGEWQAEKAVKFGEDWLGKYGTKLNAIICDNDDMSSAVQAAMNAKDRKDIVCIGVDGNKGPMTMVKNGELLATVYQDGAGQATKAVELAEQVLAGKTVAKSTMIDFVMITKDNVDKFLK